MRTTSISTASLLGTPRTEIQRMQQDLARLNKEVTTSRMADVGLNLGSATGRSVSLHIDTSSLAAFAASNNSLTSRLKVTQTALGKLNSSASDFLQQLITASGTDGKMIRAQADSALSGFIADMNAADGDDHLFAGINTGNAPIASFDAGPKAAIDAAFLAKFGFTQDDPQAANITDTQMSDFLDNEFSQIFSDPAWGTTWSSASSQPLTNRISATQTVTSSVTANEPAMRKLAMVYSMVAGLGVDNLSAGARKAVLDKAAGLAGEATDGLTSLQTNLGSTQVQVKDAMDRQSLQQDILKQRIGTLEGVDPAEAKIQIDTLTTQIEMSYSLTAKLLQISLLNYA